MYMYLSLVIYVTGSLQLAIKNIRIMQLPGLLHRNTGVFTCAFTVQHPRGILVIYI